jgi:hypothetical protein
MEKAATLTQLQAQLQTQHPTRDADLTAVTQVLHALLSYLIQEAQAEDDKKPAPRAAKKD